MAVKPANTMAKDKQEGKGKEHGDVKVPIVTDIDNSDDDQTLSWLPKNSLYKSDDYSEFVPFQSEGLKEKFLRKTKENPFVPIGKQYVSHLVFVTGVQ